MLTNYPYTFVDLKIDSNTLLLDIENMLLKSLYFFEAKLMFWGFGGHLSEGLEFLHSERRFHGGVGAKEYRIVVADGLLKLFLQFIILLLIKSDFVALLLDGLF